MTLLDPVLGTVLLLQAGILVRCVFLAHADDSQALDSLWNKFRRDVIGRASRGDGPDWVRYMDEADRVHERRIDRMRVWATAALVVGIGGTMAALALRLTGVSIDQESSDAALGGLMAAVGPALLASLSGVGNNILITLALFHWSDRRFGVYLDEFRNAIESCSVEHPPHEKFASAVRDQLGIAFREAVQTFPDAFARLDESVTALGEVTEAQSKAVLKAARELKRSADGLSEAASEVAPAAGLLRSSIDRLRALPDQLAQTLNETHARWEKAIRRDQNSFVEGVKQVLDSQQDLLESTRSSFESWERQRGTTAAEQKAEWRDAIALLQKSASEILATVEGLPATFSREVERTADTMGRQFGLEARQHVEDLTRAVRDGNDNLREQVGETARDLQNRFLDDTARVVAETLTRVHRDVEGTLLASLKEVGEGLREALRTLPANATTFAASLSTADEKLQRSIARLAESAAHLDRIAGLTEQFEASLTRALQDATARSFEPLRGQMQEIVMELRRSAGIPDAPRGWLGRLWRKLTGHGIRYDDVT
ncbi:MAG: hypothetical protein OXH75_12420 [Acidobacteria bacterium]|nr:hypothetical protein [Acidobacteriota bacterium]